MAHITKEEIVKLAQLSQLDIHVDEVEKLRTDIESVLAYVLRLQEVVGTYTENERLPKPINITRHDTVVPTDPKPLLAQAPVREDNYFVVPAILKSSGAK